MTARFQVWEMLGGVPAFVVPECMTLTEACRRLPVGLPAVIARGGVIVRDGDDVTPSRRARFVDVIARRWVRVAEGGGKPRCSRPKCAEKQAEAPAGCPVIARPFCWGCRHTLLAGAAKGVDLADLVTMMRESSPAKGSPRGVSMRGRTHRESVLLAAWSVSDVHRVAAFADIAHAVAGLGLDVLATQGKVSEIANAPLHWLELHAPRAYRVTNMGITARAAILKRDAKLAREVAT